MLRHNPYLVTEQENEKMTKLPNPEEVKKVVFELSSDSACGPDGFSGAFFQTCWEIIKVDITKLVRAFFCGHELPKFITHKNLVLIPQKEKARKFIDMRPINISGFINKVISRMLHDRMVMVLPKVISPTQSAFLKGRSITKNVLIALEIIRDINKRNQNVNAVVKLDMAKAYDRVSWAYICLVLRRMGFDEIFIDMVWRIMANNWYSIIVNGKRHGFFQSTRGLKQGDPL